MNHINESKIFWENCLYNGINLNKYYEYTGEIIAEKLILENGLKKSYSIVCGLGGNGVDGLSVGYYLFEKGVKNISIYIIGRVKHSENPTFEYFIEKINIMEGGKTFAQLPEIIHQDIYSKDIIQSDIIIEAIVGTGLKGSKLTKRSKDILNRISHFKSKIYSIDNPAPGYSPDKVFSLLYPKAKQSEVIEFKFPSEITTFCGPGEYNALWKPNRSTHKKQNGKLLIISNTSNSEALKNIVNIAKAYEVTVSIFNLGSNELRESTYLKIVKEEDLDVAILNADFIYLYEFEKTSLLNRALINEMLDYKGRKYALTGSTLRFINPEILKSLPDSLLILDRNDIYKFSEGKASIEKNLRRFCIENKTNTILFGNSTILVNKEGDLKVSYSPTLLSELNRDILSYIAASYSTKNDIWLSMRASVFSV